MSEIEKMYKNAGIAPKKCSECDNNIDCGFGKDCYPPFTTEKQFEILKIIVHSHGFNSLDKPIWDKGWDIAIAKLVNFYWEVLTTKEQQQVKGILE